MNFPHPECDLKFNHAISVDIFRCASSGGTAIAILWSIGMAGSCFEFVHAICPARMTPLEMLAHCRANCQGNLMCGVNGFTAHTTFLESKKGTSAINIFHKDSEL